MSHDIEPNSTDVDTFPSTLEKEIRINSVSEFIEKIDQLNKVDKKEDTETFYYRGHADRKWKLLPSIFRTSNGVEKEHLLFRDMVAHIPQSFSECKSALDYLVQMQHYELPTRLLDVTMNPLVALYFACNKEEHHKELGEFIIFDIPDTKIKYADSDTVAILAAISAQNKKFSLSNSLDYAQTKRSLAEANYKLENLNQEKLKSIEISIENNILPLKDINEYEELVQKAASEIGESAFISSFNENPAIVSLLHDIHTDKPSFRPVINPTDLTRVLCVRAKLNNARISRQQGCFLLFGINNEKRNPAEIPDDWKRLPTKGKRFIVRNKKQIMQELRAFGISKQTLFPELESQAQEIMAQYESK